jgi:hypothetical protein
MFVGGLTGGVTTGGSATGGFTIGGSSVDGVVGEVIKDLEERFDLVVIDAASLETAADALMLAQHVDGVLLVARATQARPVRIRDAMLDFERTRTANLATSLNFAAASDLR